MNREILFRAKSIQTGRWISGYYFEDEDSKSYIGYMSKKRYIPDTRDWDIVEYYENNPTYNWVFVKEEVVTETVGQYTGLTDKNGTKIFEGDILQGDEYPYCSDGEYNYYVEVVWFDNGCCGFGLCTHKNPKSSVRGISDGNCEWFEDFDSNNWLVIGNIYDNQELIEE